MNRSSITFGLIAAALLAGCGGGGSAPAGMTPPNGTTVLGTAVVAGAPAFVDSQQHVVYTSDADTANVSNCAGPCAAVWPPVAPPAVTLRTPWASFARGDGSQQLSYASKPLYTFASDTQPDVATGDGVNGFHIARPLAGSGNGVPSTNPGGTGY